MECYGEIWPVALYSPTHVVAAFLTALEIHEEEGGVAGRELDILIIAT